MGYPSKSDLIRPLPVLMSNESNDVPLTRNLLVRVLSGLSERLHRSFKRQVRLVVHGGAVMILHPSLSHRESTQDVDYVHRSFVSDYRALGFPDAEQRLRTCTVETARQFGLGAGWMDGHEDLELPWALDQQGRKYDPIFYASIQPQSAVPQTIFSERGLALVAIPWPWAIALKLARYAKQDPTDCAAMLRLGVAQHGIRWTLAGLEQWITERCWPMGYMAYQPSQKQQLRQRMQDALDRAFPPVAQSAYAIVYIKCPPPGTQVQAFFPSIPQAVEALRLVHSHIESMKEANPSGVIARSLLNSLEFTRYSLINYLSPLLCQTQTDELHTDD